MGADNALIECGMGHEPQSTVPRRCLVGAAKGRTRPFCRIPRADECASRTGRIPGDFGAERLGSGTGQDDPAQSDGAVQLNIQRTP